MFKKRYFSAQDDFRTGFFCKLLLFLGIFLVFVFVFVKIVSLVAGENSSGIVGQIYDFSQTTYPDSILAFSMILLAGSVILYFFHCQFAKLAKIADEIENEEDTEDTIKK